MLAVGYLVGSLLGIVIYAWVMIQVWQAKGILKRFERKTIIYPIRDVFGFSIPLLTSDFLNVLKGSAMVLILEYFRASTDVADIAMLSRSPG